MIALTNQVELISSSMANDPTPAEIRGFEVTLAALIWKANIELARADIALKKAIQEAPEKSSAAKKQFAEAGPAYERFMEAKAIQESSMEMLRTCRSHGRSLSEEMRLAR